MHIWISGFFHIIYVLIIIYDSNSHEDQCINYGSELFIFHYPIYKMYTSYIQMHTVYQCTVNTKLFVESSDMVPFIDTNP